MGADFDFRAYSAEEFDVISHLVYHYRVKHYSNSTNPVIQMRIGAVESTMLHCRLRMPFDASAQCSLVLAAIDEFGTFLAKDQRGNLPYLRTKINRLDDELRREEHLHA
jgi:hypothetical protein